jgi:hypothetical protein
VAGAELMLRLVGGYTEIVCGKLKKGNRFLKPNFEVGPKLRQGRLYRIPKISSGRVYEELLMEKGPYPGVETPDQPDVVDVLDACDVMEGVGVGLLASDGVVECVVLFGGLFSAGCRFCASTP